MTLYLLVQVPKVIPRGFLETWIYAVVGRVGHMKLIFSSGTRAFYITIKSNVAKFERINLREETKKVYTELYQLTEVTQQQESDIEKYCSKVAKDIVFSESKYILSAFPINYLPLALRFLPYVLGEKPQVHPKKGSGTQEFCASMIARTLQKHCPQMEGLQPDKMTSTDVLVQCKRLLGAKQVPISSLASSLTI